MSWPGFISRLAAIKSSVLVVASPNGCRIDCQGGVRHAEPGTVHLVSATRPLGGDAMRIG